ncbi:hypothetical protein N7513_012618 [Penicillium frequentans]|nr:hypothetical protein N7513_012618 [Penicillium glabrum]
MASRSPTAATPLPKSSVAPESPSKDATEPPQIVPFPSPQTFEIIPPLHGGLGASEAHQQDQQAPSSGNNGTSQAVQEVPTLDPNAHPPLDVKDLPTQTSSVKIRIQKARAVVEGLPDVQRSVEEQQREIAELEDRVARLRSVITDFGSRAAKT